MDIDLKCWDRPWPEQLWEFAQANYQIIVARFAKQVIGYSVFGREPGVDEVRLLRLGVWPTYRKHGVGSALLATSVHHAKCWTDNITAWLPEDAVYRGAGHFLLKRGFKAVDTRKGVFDGIDGPEDAIIFTHME